MTLNNSQEQALEERRLKCWDLRVAGHTLREIAQRMEVSPGTVHNYIVAVLERLRAETDEKASQHVAMSLQRLDKAIALVMKRIDSDDEESLDAIDRLDKLEKRRAALLGLDAPAKQELTGKDGGPLNGPVIFVPPDSDE